MERTKRDLWKLFPSSSKDFPHLRLPPFARFIFTIFRCLSFRLYDFFMCHTGCSLMASLHYRHMDGLIE